MTVSIVNAAAAAAWAAATSQTNQMNDLASALGSNWVARIEGSGGTLRRTQTYAALTVSGTTPRSIVIGSPLTDTANSTGDITRVVLRTSGGVDILTATAQSGTGPADIDFFGVIKTACRPTLAGVTFTASAGLPLVSLPAWLSGVAVNQAVQLSGTVIRPPVGSGAGLRLSYSGLANRDTLLVLAAPGGHNDSADNGVDSLELLDSAPAWTNRIAPSASTPTLVNYYPDGRPSSHHTYNHHIWNPVRNRLITHGHRSPWGSGGGLSPGASNSLNLETWTWDAEGTIVGVGQDSGACVVQDAAGRCYAKRTDYAFSEYDPVANTKTDKAAFSNVVSLGPIAYDSLRGTFFSCAWGDGNGNASAPDYNKLLTYRYEARFASQTVITFNTSSAATALLADTSIDCTMFYAAALDAFFYWTGATLYKITPNSGTTWDVSIPTLTGASLPSLTSLQRDSHSRACWVESLGVMAWLPNASSNLYCIRLA